MTSTALLVSKIWNVAANVPHPPVKNLIASTVTVLFCALEVDKWCFEARDRFMPNWLCFCRPRWTLRPGAIPAKLSDMRKLGVFVFLLFTLRASAAPSEWVPMRWPWSDAQSLDLLAKSPINTLLLPPASPLAAAATSRGLNTLLVVRPGSDPTGAAEEVRKLKLAGLVLDGDFPPQVAAKVRDTLSGSQAILVELTSRVNMHLAGSDPILGTWQGVWPGIQVTDSGKAKAGPSGSAWIDTNAG